MLFFQVGYVDNTWLETQTRRCLALQGCRLCQLLYLKSKCNTQMHCFSWYARYWAFSICQVSERVLQMTTLHPHHPKPKSSRPGMSALQQLISWLPRFRCHSIHAATWLLKDLLRALTLGHSIQESRDSLQEVKRQCRKRKAAGACIEQTTASPSSGLSHKRSAILSEVIGRFGRLDVSPTLTGPRCTLSGSLPMDGSLQASQSRHFMH